MKKLFLKLFLASVPLILILAFYVYTDPFLVVRQYPHVYETKIKHLELNEDYCMLERFKDEYPKKHYNTFIFGSSRGALYRGDHMEHLFASKSYFTYTVAQETIYGVAKKLEFLDRTGTDIKNVLITMDNDLLSTGSNSKGHLYRKHPSLSGETWLDFQIANFMDVFNTEFISSYYKLKKTTQADYELSIRDPYSLFDTLIMRNRDSFYSARQPRFDQIIRTDSQRFNKNLIDEEVKTLLISIKHILDKHHTNYIILIHPMYDQIKMAPVDFKILQTTFDQNRIFDYSGINNITKSKYNYYEPMHYRRNIVDSLMDDMYVRTHPETVTK